MAKNLLHCSPVSVTAVIIIIITNDLVNIVTLLCVQHLPPYDEAIRSPGQCKCQWFSVRRVSYRYCSTLHV